MRRQIPDAGLDTLLDFDGQVFVVDSEGKHWVRFVVKRVSSSSEIPHGLRYSLTLHTESGERLIGFDNAHPVQPTAGPAGRSRKGATIDIGSGPSSPMRTRMPPRCWRTSGAEVDAVLKEGGVIP